MLTKHVGRLMREGSAKEEDQRILEELDELEN